MTDTKYFAIGALMAGAILDTLLGDPRNFPHPVKEFGKCINYLEQRLNKGQYKIFKGLIMCALLSIGVWVIYYLLQNIAAINPFTQLLFSSLFIFYGLSNRSLIEEGLKIEQQLTKGDIQKSRIMLSEIVGRDTSQLSPHKIRMAILETMSENLSDGVVAPLFYYTLGGVPLMMSYKMVNTLDSMVGYKNYRFLLFGRASAKFDDFANYIPARITALLIFIVTLKYKSFKYMIHYGRSHSSPNSGYPEAALAGALNCTLGGPSVYSGIVVSKPYIGKEQREIEHQDIIKTAHINSRVFILSLLIVLLSIIIFP
ncbi:MAG: adenosylcobinamide-phosphate synthase CbiB [Bacteroidales bacterium]|nr:adenosylcobinamide-phosphate synthase CbiB [Bacteroidales bacterium]